MLRYSPGTLAPTTPHGIEVAGGVVYQDPIHGEPRCYEVATTSVMYHVRVKAVGRAVRIRRGPQRRKVREP